MSNAGTAEERHRFRTSNEYILDHSRTPLAEFEAKLDFVLGKVERVRPVTADLDIFEVGAGLGWFEVICSKRGLRCSAIEVNPLIREAAFELARQHDVEVEIELGNIENIDLGRSRYDLIIATSVFEHVRHYGRGLAAIYEALRPGGVFFFYSTNKFSPNSGEYPQFPLYGWYPYSVRRRIRVSRQGPGIVESSGIDFNQFTYWGLVRHFRSLGYSRILDRLDCLSPDDRSNRSPAKRSAIRAAKTVAPVRAGARAFGSGNLFVCVK